MDLRRLPPSALACLLALGSVATGFAQSTPTHDDVPYAFAPVFGGVRTLLLDIYAPTGGATFPLGAPSPVVVYIHGGGWLGGSHDVPPAVLLPLRAQGVAIASIDYRLSPERIFPAQIHDVKAAIRFLRANAAQYGLDPDRFATMGSSAGGHLAALAATSGNAPELEGAIGDFTDTPSTVIAAVDYYGPTDILGMMPDVTVPPGTTINHDAPNSPESRLIGFDGPNEGIGVLRANFANPNPPFPAKVALAAALNPITHLDPLDPPIFIAHGTADDTVPIGQSERLRDAMEALDLAHCYTAVPGAGHGPLGRATDDAMRGFLVARFLAQTPAHCRADLDANGVVDAVDLNLLLNAWGTASGDITGDGGTDAADLGALLDGWGACG